jgi:hypothetical protein
VRLRTRDISESNIAERDIGERHSREMDIGESVATFQWAE